MKKCDTSEIHDKKGVIYVTSEKTKYSVDFRDIPYKYVGDNSYKVVFQTLNYNNIWEALWSII